MFLEISFGKGNLVYHVFIFFLEFHMSLIEYFHD